MNKIQNRASTNQRSSKHWAPKPGPSNFHFGGSAEFGVHPSGCQCRGNTLKRGPRTRPDGQNENCWLGPLNWTQRHCYPCRRVPLATREADRSSAGTLADQAAVGVWNVLFPWSFELGAWRFRAAFAPP
jgi:hypothetical protein